MNKLVDISSPEAIPAEYRGGPIGLLLEYHNLNRPQELHTAPQLLIGTCMDYRVALRLPDKFAYVIRTAGANLAGLEFTVGFAIAVGGVGAIALIGHTDCGMAQLLDKQHAFIDGLVQIAGWERDDAEKHFEQLAPTFETGNEVDFIVNQAERLATRYPKIPVAPLIYQVEDGRLYLVRRS